MCVYVMFSWRFFVPSLLLGDPWVNRVPSLGFCGAHRRALRDIQREYPYAKVISMYLDISSVR